MGFLIGMDIGGTKCAVLLAEYSEYVNTERNKGDQTDQPGRRKKAVRFLGRRELATVSVPLPEEMIRELCRSGTYLLKENRLSAADLKGIGISCGGPLNSRTGVILSPPNLPGWDQVEIVKMTEEYFGVPARLVNDANAGALAEWKFGAGYGVQNMVFLTLGTGCGSGLILNGRLYEGATDNAGECGHIRLEKYGPAGYGKCGSMEGFCSGGGISRLGELIGTACMQAGKQTSLETDIKAGTLTARIVAEYARAGDPAACQVFWTAAAQLGRGLAVIIDLLDPECIVLGGMYVRCRDLLEEGMKRAMKEECLEIPAGNCRIVPAALGEQIGDYAAAAAAAAALPLSELYW